MAVQRVLEGTAGPEAEDGGARTGDLGALRSTPEMDGLHWSRRP
jgi:hypothetical protein